jgi:hypothetical protein
MQMIPEFIVSVSANLEFVLSLSSSAPGLSSAVPVAVDLPNRAESPS